MNLEELEINCKNCKKCELCKTRTNVVFSDGKNEAKILLIGEAPGETEDLEAKPFVGKAGKLLDKYLKDAGLSRKDDIYIANIVKCRPPKNRVPKKNEKEACKGYLIEQISIINPKLILLCGSTSMDEFIMNKKITEVHGKIFDIKIKNKEYKAMPILHPSPLCRFENKKEIMKHDLSIAREFVF